MEWPFGNNKLNLEFEQTIDEMALFLSQASFENALVIPTGVCSFSLADGR